MSRGKEKLFTDNQLTILLDRPEEFASRHRTAHKTAVNTTVNNAVVQAIECFPALSEFMTPETKERLQLQTDPRYLTQPIADIYPDQTAHAIAGLVLTEQEEDESDEAFLDRLDEIWEDIEQDVRRMLGRTAVSFKVERTRCQFKRQLADRLASELYEPERWQLGMVVVSIHELIDWISDQNQSTDLKELPGILAILFSDRELPRETTDVEDYWDGLTTVADKQGISPPVGEEWSFDFANPTLADFERHSRALDGLHDELYMSPSTS